MELEEKFIKLCLFEIIVEYLNHISPDNNHNEEKKASLSKKYLAVLDKETRQLLGIKKKFKSYSIHKCVPKNSDINYEAIHIFTNFNSGIDITLNDYQISVELNEFFAVYHGIDALNYCNNINWDTLNQISSRLNPLYQKFIALKHRSEENFETFISNILGQKRIYFSASNSYDLQLPAAEFNMGITDSGAIQPQESIHIVQFARKRNKSWLGVADDFRNNFIEFMMITFTLSKLKLSSEMFIPLLLDLEDVDLRKQSIERKKPLRDKICRIVNAGEKYLEKNSSKDLTYFDLLYPSGLIRTRIPNKLNSRKEYREFTHFFSKDQEEKRKLTTLFEVINYENQKRCEYEKQCVEHYELVSEIIKSKQEFTSVDE